MQLLDAHVTYLAPTMKARGVLFLLAFTTRHLLAARKVRQLLVLRLTLGWRQLPSEVHPGFLDTCESDFLKFWLVSAVLVLVLWEGSPQSRLGCIVCTFWIRVWVVTTQLH